jgi:hypothetical protein
LKVVRVFHSHFLERPVLVAPKIEGHQAINQLEAATLSCVTSRRHGAATAADLQRQTSAKMFSRDGIPSYYMLHVALNGLFALDLHCSKKAMPIDTEITLQDTTTSIHVV